MPCTFSILLQLLFLLISPSASCSAIPEGAEEKERDTIKRKIKRGNENINNSSLIFCRNWWQKIGRSWTVYLTATHSELERREVIEERNWKMKQWSNAMTWTLSCLSKGRAGSRDDELYFWQQHPVPPQCEGWRVVWGSRGRARSQTEVGAQAGLLGGAATSPHLLSLHFLSCLLLPFHLLLSLAAAPYVLLQEECLHWLYHC